MPEHTLAASPMRGRQAPRPSWLIGLAVLFVAYLLDMLGSGIQEINSLLNGRLFADLQPERMVSLWMTYWSILLAIRTAGAVLLAVNVARLDGVLRTLAWVAVALHACCLVARLLMALGLAGTWAHAGGLLWAGAEASLLASLALWARHRESQTGEVLGWLVAAAVLFLGVAVAGVNVFNLPSAIYDVTSKLSLVVSMMVVVQLIMLATAVLAKPRRTGGAPPVIRPPRAAGSAAPPPVV
jgi:hypothetical protein